MRNAFNPVFEGELKECDGKAKISGVFKYEEVVRSVLVAMYIFLAVLMIIPVLFGSTITMGDSPVFSYIFPIVFLCSITAIQLIVTRANMPRRRDIIRFLEHTVELIG